MPMSGRHRLSRLPSSLARGKRPKRTSSSCSDARRMSYSSRPAKHADLRLVWTVQGRWR